MIRGLAGVGSGAGETPGTDPRLRPAAHEFEACLMKEFLEPLRRDPLFAEGNEGDAGGGSGDALMSFGSEALAKAISERGGFGIAETIIGHFGKATGGGKGKGANPEVFLRRGHEP